MSGHYDQQDLAHGLNHTGLQPNELQPNELQPNELQPNELQPNELQPNAGQSTTYSADALLHESNYCDPRDDPYRTGCIPNQHDSEGTQPAFDRNSLGPPQMPYNDRNQSYRSIPPLRNAFGGHISHGMALSNYGIGQQRRPDLPDQSVLPQVPGYSHPRSLTPLQPAPQSTDMNPVAGWARQSFDWHNQETYPSGSDVQFPTANVQSLPEPTPNQGYHLQKSETGSEEKLKDGKVSNSRELKRLNHEDTQAERFYGKAEKPFDEKKDPGVIYVLRRTAEAGGDVFINKDRTLNKDSFNEATIKDVIHALQYMPEYFKLSSRLYYQLTPSQQGTRAERMKKCMLENCSAKNKTIAAGSLQVSCTLHSDLVEQGKWDPMHITLCLHAYCFETIFSREQIWKLVKDNHLEFDYRPNFKKETRNPMQLKFGCKELTQFWCEGKIHWCVKNNLAKNRELRQNMESRRKKCDEDPEAVLDEMPVFSDRFYLSLQYLLFRRKAEEIPVCKTLKEFTTEPEDYTMHESTRVKSRKMRNKGIPLCLVGSFDHHCGNCKVEAVAKRLMDKWKLTAKGKLWAAEKQVDKVQKDRESLTKTETKQGTSLDKLENQLQKAEDKAANAILDMDSKKERHDVDKEHFDSLKSSENVSRTAIEGALTKFNKSQAEYDRAEEKVKMLNNQIDKLKENIERKKVALRTLADRELKAKQGLRDMQDNWEKNGQKDFITFRNLAHELVDDEETRLFQENKVVYEERIPPVNATISEQWQQPQAPAVVEVPTANTVEGAGMIYGQWQQSQAPAAVEVPTANTGEGAGIDWHTMLEVGSAAGNFNYIRRDDYSAAVQDGAGTDDGPGPSVAPLSRKRGLEDEDDEDDNPPPRRKRRVNRPAAGSSRRAPRGR
ncbi:hypothetical protein ED733_002990 [Metarhizium rileyi]|uniref:Uncharacterized protein n=1 Tax=Metarhizium rileyi (strain RCEF 4871) TaxID=1649241 RepID=A0A5C6GEB0_METRR|nr:hypothetical protein ED733_002990 [Metarhizium rileyi]